MIEYISKADIFQEIVLRVDEIGEKKRKKREMHAEYKAEFVENKHLRPEN